MQVFNPFLPCGAYIPHGGPLLHDGRVYVYGAREDAPGRAGDIVCWFAPLHDLGDWRCTGEVYSRRSDPANRRGPRLQAVPDVTEGPDGRWYLYYALFRRVGVAVCDTPDGTYSFLGHVRYPDGVLFGRRRGDGRFTDLAVLTDADGRVWLYTGQKNGCAALEMEKDMRTVRRGPVPLLEDAGIPDGHAFLAAPSVRKAEGRYVLVYTSEKGQELCCAVSDRPDGGFCFGGTLVAQGEPYTAEDRADLRGTLAELNGDRYVFYSWQSGRRGCGRRACAEKLTPGEDGGFRPAEATSCGLNGGPLPGSGEYHARIACGLWRGRGQRPRFSRNGKDGDPGAIEYIARMRDGAVAGFSYFDLRQLSGIRVSFAGRCDGILQVSDDPAFTRVCATVPARNTANFANAGTEMCMEDGVRPLYFRFLGKGALDFYAFELQSRQM